MRIHSWTVRIQMLLGFVTITSEMGIEGGEGGIYWFEPLATTRFYFQHPAALNFHINLSSSPIRHPERSLLASPRSVNEIYISVCEGGWKNKARTEIITLHSALGFNAFLIKVGGFRCSPNKSFSRLCILLYLHETWREGEERVEKSGLIRWWCGQNKFEQNDFSNRTEVN